MSSRARIAGGRTNPGSPVRLAVAVLALGTAVALGGCIASVARSESPSGGSAAPPRPSAAPEPTGPPGPTPIPSFVRPTPTPLPTFFAYLVKSGDSLNTIAHRFGTTGRSIAYWNRVAYPSLDPEAPSYKPNLVRVGWTLVLIPNSVVDEQTLPDPTPNPTDPSEAEPTPS
jgi:hypothetical protein